VTPEERDKTNEAKVVCFAFKPPVKKARNPVGILARRVPPTLLILMAFYFIFYYSFIHMCIHCLDHFSPLFPSPTLSPSSPSVPGRSCSAFINTFVEEKRQAQ
jgi:hypothetical protein